jgi:hemerythrin superfamily protein
MKKKSTASKAAAKSKAAKSRKSSSSKSAKSTSDIIELILKDHKPLKKLIKVLKSDKAEKNEKKAAFKEFAPLLLWHAQPEEKVLYVHMKDDSKELRVEGYEGDTEHALASQMIDEVKQSENDDQWMARVKVLAELVEHHIEEEEEEMFPDIRKAFNLEAREQMGEDYLQLREEFEMPEEPVRRDSSKKNKNAREMHLN